MQRKNTGFILAAALALAVASPALARDGGGGGRGGGLGGSGGGAAAAPAASAPAAAGGGAMAAPGAGPRNAGMARSGGAHFSGGARFSGRTFSGGRSFSGARFAGRGFRNDGFHRGFRHRNRAFFALGADPFFYDDYAYDPSYQVDEPSYEVAPGTDDGYCEQRYRSYDPDSGTYLGFDGLRHPCP